VFNGLYSNSKRFNHFKILCELNKIYGLKNKKRKADEDYGLLKVKKIFSFWLLFGERAFKNLIKMLLMSRFV
jgi:hypothetical protein